MEITTALIEERAMLLLKSLRKLFAIIAIRTSFRILFTFSFFVLENILSHFAGVLRLVLPFHVYTSTGNHCGF